MLSRTAERTFPPSIRTEGKVNETFHLMGRGCGQGGFISGLVSGVNASSIIAQWKEDKI
jgi:hypothetical protein